MLSVSRSKHVLSALQMLQNGLQKHNEVFFFLTKVESNGKCLSKVYRCQKVFNFFFEKKIAGMLKKVEQGSERSRFKKTFFLEKT